MWSDLHPVGTRALNRFEKYHHKLLLWAVFPHHSIDVFVVSWLKVYLGEIGKGIASAWNWLERRIHYQRPSPLFFERCCGRWPKDMEVFAYPPHITSALTLCPVRNIIVGVMRMSLILRRHRASATQVPLSPNLSTALGHWDSRPHGLH